jgi:hypothetical protein
LGAHYISLPWGLTVGTNAAITSILASTISSFVSVILAGNMGNITRRFNEFRNESLISQLRSYPIAIQSLDGKVTPVLKIILKNDYKPLFAQRNLISIEMVMMEPWFDAGTFINDFQYEIVFADQRQSKGYSNKDLLFIKEVFALAKKYIVFSDEQKEKLRNLFPSRYSYINDLIRDILNNEYNPSVENKANSPLIAGGLPVTTPEHVPTQPKKVTIEKQVSYLLEKACNGETILSSDVLVLGDPEFSSVSELTAGSIAVLQRINSPKTALGDQDLLESIRAVIDHLNMLQRMKNHPLHGDVALRMDDPEKQQLFANARNVRAVLERIRNTASNSLTAFEEFMSITNSATEIINSSLEQLNTCSHPRFPDFVTAAIERNKAQFQTQQNLIDGNKTMASDRMRDWQQMSQWTRDADTMLNTMLAVGLESVDLEMGARTLERIVEVGQRGASVSPG